METETYKGKPIHIIKPKIKTVKTEHKVLMNSVGERGDKIFSFIANNSKYFVFGLFLLYAALWLIKINFLPPC